MFGEESVWRNAMGLEQSPLRSGLRLTPALLDFYIARARAERAKAIAEFGRHVAARLARSVMWLVRREPKVKGTGRIAGAPTVR